MGLLQFIGYFRVRFVLNPCPRLSKFLVFIKEYHKKDSWKTKGYVLCIWLFDTFNQVILLRWGYQLLVLIPRSAVDSSVDGLEW